MRDRGDRPAEPASERTAVLLVEFALAHARALARHGHYAEAKVILDGVRRDSAALDLLARIHAQQGHLDEADACWAEAERVAPGGREFAAGRRRVAKIRGRRNWWFIPPNRRGTRRRGRG